jgi:hypothetical protein
MIVCESGLPLSGAGAKRGNGPLRVGSVTSRSSAMCLRTVSGSSASLIAHRPERKPDVL